MGTIVVECARIAKIQSLESVVRRTIRFAKCDTTVLSILLSRQTKNKEWCFLCKWRQHAQKDSLFENYELSLRLTNEISTNRSEHVHCIGFYAISYVWGCGVKVSTLMPVKDPTSCTRVNVQDVSWTGYIT
jgi:hypothetical protein